MPLFTLVAFYCTTSRECILEHHFIRLQCKVGVYILKRIEIRTQPCHSLISAVLWSSYIQLILVLKWWNQVGHSFQSENLQEAKIHSFERFSDAKWCSDGMLFVVLSQRDKGTDASQWVGDDWKHLHLFWKVIALYVLMLNNFFGSLNLRQTHFNATSLSS